MGFRKDAYAKVWEVTPGQGRFTKVRLSVSRKNKDTGEYVQDFSGFSTFVGQAHAKAQQLRGNERIRLGDVDVTTTYDRERQKEYVNYTVFDFELADSFGSSSPQPARAGNPVEANPVEADLSGELPF